MTVRQQGGIFGRNPTLNNGTVDGILTVDQIVEETGAAGITLDGVTPKDGNVVLDDDKGIDNSTWVDVDTFTANSEEVGFEPELMWYRVDVKTGEFTVSDDIDIRLGREDKDRH